MVYLWSKEVKSGAKRNMSTSTPVRHVNKSRQLLSQGKRGRGRLRISRRGFVHFVYFSVLTVPVGWYRNVLERSVLYSMWQIQLVGGWQSDLNCSVNSVSEGKTSVHFPTVREFSFLFFFWLLILILHLISRSDLTSYTDWWGKVLTATLTSTGH